jgi:hypothetical protein
MPTLILLTLTRTLKLALPLARQFSRTLFRQEMQSTGHPTPWVRTLAGVEEQRIAAIVAEAEDGLLPLDEQSKSVQVKMFFH